MIDDQFLYRIRERPPADFLAQLKSNLDRHAPFAGLRPRRAFRRTLIVALLIGGAAFALTMVSTYWRVTPREPIASEPPNSVPSTARSVPSPAPDASASSTESIKSTNTPETSAPNDAHGASARPTDLPVSRDYIGIFGSEFLYPYTSAVADDFSRKTNFTRPSVTIEGTSAGLFYFCRGDGMQFPDIVNAARAIRPSELRMCASNGVYDVVEMKLGYQVAVLARARVASAFPLAGPTVFLALSETIPPLDVKNTTEFWPLPKPRDLHDRRIQILGPGQASPIGIALGSLLLEHGCRTYRPGKTRFLQNRFIPDARCTELRQDAAYEATSDNGLLTERDTRRLIADPALVGLYDYRSFLAAGKQLMAADIDGIPPEPETFANGEYPASRTFYLYIKKSHVTRLPGMREFLALYLEEIALGRDWPGFVPLAANDLAKVHEIVTALQTLPLPP